MFAALNFFQTGGGVPVYLSDVFSAFPYTGNGSTKTITNNINLSGKGGLVWVKNRTTGTSHRLYDTARGANQYLNSGSTDGTNTTDTGQSFTSTGFEFASNNGTVNQSGDNYASWSFRKQPKFFDIVTWTGTGTNQDVPHSLGSFPACIIYKRTDSTSDWFVSTRNSSGTWEFMKLNSTAASTATADPVVLGVTSTTFDPYRLWGNTNNATYVAYIFAHNASGFGASGADNAISCSSFVTDSSGYARVTLGYRPQFVIVKSKGVSSWQILDTARGWSTSGSNQLNAQSSGAESSVSIGNPIRTGFDYEDSSLASQTLVYIAIRES